MDVRKDDESADGLQVMIGGIPPFAAKAENGNGLPDNQNIAQCDSVINYPCLTG